MNDQQQTTYRKRLTELFSGYRAEWLDERIFDLFTEPSYFPQLTTSHPCFLEGGRGTGKTTVLRSLSYRGQSILRPDRPDQACDWEYFGMYYRINTNRVRAFTGRELDPPVWIRLFGHYLNLELVELIVGLLNWYGERYPKSPKVSGEALVPTAVALGLGQVTDLQHLQRKLHLSKLNFEYAVNNIADSSSLPPFPCKVLRLICS